MANEIINLTFQNVQPTLVLIETSPSEAPAEFTQLLVAEKPDVNDLEGFTTNPLAYYILAST